LILNCAASGSVAGGKLYGAFPNLTIDGPDDAGFGRLIPTTSVEQYVATLTRWFGVSDSVLPTLFPHLSRFPVQNLGFMVRDGEKHDAAVPNRPSRTRALQKSLNRCWVA